MQQLSNNNLPSGLEKYLKYILLAGVGFLGFWFWGSISSFVVMTLKNTLKTVVYGGILAAIVLFVWSYPNFIAMSYRTICRKIQGIFIKMDPLSYMDRYADILSSKLKGVRKTIITLAGEKVRLGRKIKEEYDLKEKSLRLGAAAKQLGQVSQANLHASRAKGAMDSIALYSPNMKRTEKSLEFLNMLAENWDVSITQMRELIERRRTEFKILKANAKANNLAAEFLKGETEEGRIYLESIKAFEDTASNLIAGIEDFEKRAKPIMEGAAIEKLANESEGMKILDDYINSGKLIMPDFSKLEATNITYEEVKEKKKFNLLNH